MIVRELSCELLGMNYSEFTGLVNELGNYACKRWQSKVIPFVGLTQKQGYVYMNTKEQSLDSHSKIGLFFLSFFNCWGKHTKSGPLSLKPCHNYSRPNPMIDCTVQIYLYRFCPCRLSLFPQEIMNSPRKTFFHRYNFSTFITSSF